MNSSGLLYISVNTCKINPRRVKFKMTRDEYFMRMALEEALKSFESAEIPVGAVMVSGDEVLSRAHNEILSRNDPTAHAEIIALRQATHNIANYRLPGSILIVTIEPCIMCVGAMIQARIEELIYGAADPRYGAVRSCYQLADENKLNHRIQVRSGILEKECGALMSSFFASRR